MISIIVPIYNVESYLCKCVDSLLNQSYRDIEIILVDDGSSDRSKDIADEYARKDSRVKTYHKINGGLSDARNYGIERANGECCLLVDSDDYIELNTVELCVKSVIENNSDIVVFDMVYEYADRSEESSGGNFVVSSFNDDINIIEINNSACNKMYRTSLLREIEFPKGMLYEDLATIPIVLSKAKRISKVNKPLYHYVQRESSIVHKLDERVFDIYKAINRIKKHFDNKYEQLFDDMYIKHGLYLTTIRIKDNANDVVNYLKLNNKNLDKYYPEWRKIRYFKKYGFKENIIFKLLQKNKFRLVKMIYKR